MDKSFEKLSKKEIVVMYWSALVVEFFIGNKDLTPQEFGDKIKEITPEEIVNKLRGGHVIRPRIFAFQLALKGTGYATSTFIPDGEVGEETLYSLMNLFKEAGKPGQG